MEQIGVVKSLNENKAVLRIKRASMCGENCKSCSGCDSSTQDVTVINETDAKIGDVVKFELETNKVILSSFLVYILPIIILIIGYISLNIVWGIAFFVIMFIILKLFDKKIGEKYMGRITKIIDRCQN